MKMRKGHGTVLWLYSPSEVDGRTVAMRIREALLDYKVPVLSLDPVELAAVVVPHHLPSTTRQEIKRSMLVQTAYMAVREGTVVIIVAGPRDDPDRDRVRGGVPAFVQISLQRASEPTATGAQPLPVGETRVIDLDATPLDRVVLNVLEALHEPYQHGFSSDRRAYTGPVSRVMNLIAVFLRPDDTMDRAKELVLQSGVRHLPVVEESRAVGMVTLTDLYALECLTGADVESVYVRDAMATEVVSVDVSTPVDEVAQQMVERRVGSAVVTDGGVPVGIFTASNACWALGYGTPEENLSLRSKVDRFDETPGVRAGSALN